MDLASPHAWLVFLHVLGAFVFAAGHGVSVAVAYAIRGTREPSRLRSLLDLSAWSLNLAGVGLIVLLVSGIIVGIGGGWFGRWWIWVSLLLFVVVSVLMTPLGVMWFGKIRRALGIRTREMKATDPDPVPASPEELDALLKSNRPELLALVGGGGFAVILWLMMFKPF
jgi:hypothetical protein